MTQGRPSLVLVKGASKARFCLELWNLANTALLARFQNPTCRLLTIKGVGETTYYYCARNITEQYFDFFQKKLIRHKIVTENIMATTKIHNDVFCSLKTNPE